MDNLTGSMKDVAFATSPREFDLSYSTTLEEIMEKLNARRAAFQMPFQIKGGIPGQRISFEKEPNVDVGLWLFLKDGTHIRIQPVITGPKCRLAVCALIRTVHCARASRVRQSALQRSAAPISTP